MKIKSSNLADRALDWATTKATGAHKSYLIPEEFAARQSEGKARYSTDWALMGPIIESEKISVAFHLVRKSWRWTAATTVGASVSESGATALIAAARCLCASKLGDEIEIPDGLV